MQTQPEASTAAERPAGPEAVAERHAAGALFALLGRCLEEEPDGVLLEALRGPLRGPLEGLGFDPGEGFYEGPVEPLREVLAEEYTGLFVAPGGVSPYHSVFETGALFREPCDRAAEAYRRAGWDYRRCQSGEFPDHAGTMLAFVGLLYQREADALDRGDPDGAVEAAAQRRSFTLGEVGPWLPGWCGRAAAAAFHPFYAAVLRLSEAALWRELEAVADRRRLRELVGLNRREPKKLDYDADFRKASGL